MVVSRAHSIAPYERYLSKFRGCDVNILELGVQSGGSQDMWLWFFGPKAHAYGADMEPAVQKFSGTRITNFVGDLGSAHFLARLCREIPRIDIVLDDASHISWHQIFAFERLWPCLSPGGVYIVEDIDSSFKVAKPFNGGVGVKGTFVEYAKAKLEEMQAYWSCGSAGPDGHWAGKKHLAGHWRCPDNKSPLVQPTNLTRTAAAMHVHDGLIVFDKEVVPRMSPRNLDFGGARVKKRFQGYEGVKDGKPGYGGAGRLRALEECDVPNPFRDMSKAYLYMAASERSVQNSLERRLQKELATESSSRELCAAVARAGSLEATALGMEGMRRLSSDGHAQRELFKTYFSGETCQSDLLRWDLRVSPGYDAERGAANSSAMQEGNRMHRQLVSDAFAKIGSFEGLDVDALAQEAKQALKPNCVACSAAVPLAKIPHLQPVLEDERVRRAVALYLGPDAQLSGYMVLRLGSRVSTKAYRSGEWHHDRCGRRLKLFVYLDAVGERDHPTMIVRRSHRLAYFTDSNDKYARFSDRWVKQTYGDRIVPMHGPKGGGFIFDTNSVHRGDIDGVHSSRDVVILEFDEKVKLKVQPACAIGHPSRFNLEWPLRAYWSPPEVKAVPRSRSRAKSKRDGNASLDLGNELSTLARRAYGRIFG